MDNGRELGELLELRNCPDCCSTIAKPIGEHAPPSLFPSPERAAGPVTQGQGSMKTRPPLVIVELQEPLPA
jgi:hypothetical protein